MCGISGFVDFNNKSDIGILNKMVSALNYRGPDDSGSVIYEVDNTLVGMGHNRLSIIDLSPAGHQPMVYNHFSIVFNGEIYNFKEIKNELIVLGHTFNSGSDTEVILRAFAEWGNSCVTKFIGMFAFAIFDKSLKKVSLFRDRAGVKPLFYYWKDGIFMFASELKAITVHPAFQKEINKNSVH